MKKNNTNYVERFAINELDLEDPRDRWQFQDNLTYVLESDQKFLGLHQRAEKLTQLRENIEKFGWEKGLNKSKIRLKFFDEQEQEIKNYNSTLHEIARIRKDYVESGGSDPEFLLNLQNLETFYKQHKFHPVNISILNDLDQNNKSFYSTRYPQNSQFLDDQKQSFFDLKDSQNEQLVNELERLKFSSDKLNEMVRQTSTNLNNLQLNLSGVDPFLQKAMETQRKLGISHEDPENRTQEEKILIKVIVQEQDAQRALQKIPVDSQLYQYKYQQLSQLSRQRTELEKIVQEQKFQNMRVQWGGAEKSEFDQKKKLQIAERLRRNIYGYSGERKYQPLEGFVIHWDFCLHIPKKYDKSKITFGVFCRGETYFSPRSLEDHLCVVENLNNKKCLYFENDFLYDIPANKDVILVIEMQFEYIDIDEQRKIDVYGWTMLELFDMKKDLLRGKFKVPFYSTKTNPNMLVDQLKNLTSIANTLLHLRISFPQDSGLELDETKDPSNKTDEYFIPFIHRKTLIRANNPLDLERLDEDAYGYWLPRDPSWDQMKKKEVITEESSEDEPLIKPTYNVINIPEEEPHQRNKLPQKPKHFQGIIRKGLLVRINGIRNYFEMGSLKVRCALVHLTNVLLDELENPCSFETDVIDPPFYGQNISKIVDIEKYQESLDQAIQNHFTDEADFYEVPGQVYFEDEYIFFTDLEYYSKVNECHENMFLAFQILAQEVEDQEGMHVMDQNIDFTKTEKKFYGLGWLLFPIYSNQKVKNGRHCEFIFLPPIIPPPFQIDEVFLQNVILDFYIQEYEYDMNTIKKAYANMIDARKQRNKKRNDMKKRKAKNRWADMPLDMRPFIENRENQVIDKPFEKGNGIDFYVDGSRFLADNVTVSKIVVYIVNQNGQDMYKPQAGLPELNSMTYSPIFNYRMELRAPHFDPTLMALITVETIDYETKEVAIVGFSVINFFLNRITKKQPTSENDSDIILQNGFYQIPIYCQEPIRRSPFNLTRFKDLDRLPCASLLIRINLAPMTEDNLRSLTLDDVPQKDWEKVGLWIPAPPYGTGLYNTQFCELRDTEKQLFFLRQRREDIQIKDSAMRLLSYFGQGKEMTKYELQEWIDKTIRRTPNTEIINLIYFAQYQTSTGFKVSLDGFHKIPDQRHPLVAIYSLDPPAAFYQDVILDPNAGGIILNSNYNWESPLQSPMFNEGFFTFKDVAYHKNTVLMIDIRQVQISEKMTRIKIVPYAWTILPIFTGNKYINYVKSGIYQIPVFKGAIPKTLIEIIPKSQEDPWEFVIDKMKKKLMDIEFLEYMSCIVRLLDSQREGHFQHPFDYTRMSYEYLKPIQKSKLGHYVFNSEAEQRLIKSKKMQAFAPNKYQIQEFNEQLTQRVSEKLGIRHFQKK